MKTETKAAIIGASALIIAALIGIIPSILESVKDKKTTPNSSGEPKGPNVEVVKVHIDSHGWVHGFHTGKGYIVTLAVDKFNRGEVFPFSWVSTSEPTSRTAIVEERGSLAPSVMLLRIQEDNWSKYTLDTRISASLKVGDKVIRYISENDLAPGTVKNVGIDTSIWKGEVRQALITSPILGPGEAGAPILDENGKVVGIGIASNRSEQLSISAPIERVKVSFPHAF